jgi:hypothetical protein
MSDSGEGLVDAEARLQEQIEAREAERRRRTSGPVKDPEKVRAAESLRLARTDLERQLVVATSDVRRKQLKSALAEIDKRLAASA